MNEALIGLALGISLLFVHEISHAVIAKLLGYFDGFFLCWLGPGIKIKSPIPIKQYIHIEVAGFFGSLFFFILLNLFFHFTLFLYIWASIFIICFAGADTLMIIKAKKTPGVIA